MPPLWLGDRRGHLLDWTTQRCWVQATGRLLDLREHAWLAGPIGDTRRIGPDWFERLAAAEGLHVRAPSPDGGLMASFAELAGPGFDPARVHASVRDFYQHTPVYELDVWSEWRRPARSLRRALSRQPREDRGAPLRVDPREPRAHPRPGRPATRRIARSVSARGVKGWVAIVASASSPTM